MHTLSILLIVLATAFFVWSIITRPRRERAWNIAAGTHAGGKVSRLSDAAITTRFLIVKAGSDANHVAVCSGVTDVPIGVCTDEAAAAEAPIDVQMLGGAAGTILVTAGAAITAGALVATTAAGKAQTAVSTQYPIGRAVTDASGDGDTIEVQPMISQVALS